MSHPTQGTPESVEQPNYELLRSLGWSVGSVIGRYCVAWRGADEVVLTWQDGEWKQIAARGAFRQAA